jgi:hypothetical protein
VRRVTVAVAFTFFGGGLPALGRRHLPPQRRPRLAGSLRGGGACVQHRARRDKENSGRGSCVASVGATARVWRMERWRNGGGCGRWNGVGRGRWGAGGRVHRRNCAGGRAEARIGRWGSGEVGEVSVFSWE